jgi:disulfide bond formation protein DsbB
MGDTDSPQVQETAPAPTEAPSPLVWAAFIFACLTTAGSLGLSRLLQYLDGRHIKACLLCGYQRTYILSVVAVLGLGLFLRAARPRYLSLYALPMALAAVGVSLFQNYMEFTGIVECPKGFLKLGSAPNQALVAQAILFGILLVDALRQRAERPRGSFLAAVVFGLGLTLASLIANPAEVPAWDYPDKEPDICRTPYHGPK